MKKKHILFIWILLLFLLALSVLGIYFTDALYGYSGYRLAVVINALVFYGLLAAVLGLAVWISRCRKKEETFGDQRQFGLIHFGSNREALAMDTLMVFSVVALGICELGSPIDKLPSFCALAMVVFSFGMHCILNGMNYRYLTKKDERGEKDE